jgi:hypothetical protein
MSSNRHTPVPSGSGPPPTVLVLGDQDALTDAVAQRLSEAGATVEVSSEREDAHVKETLLADRWTAVAIVTRDDVLALRLTLLCAHVRSELPLWATLFDRTIVHQLHNAVPKVRILSPAGLVAEELAARCLAVGARPRSAWSRGVRLVDDALRLLVAAGASLFAVLVAEVVISRIALHENLIDAVFFSARALATITDSPHAAAAPVWFKLVATITSLLAVALLAVFTAALVRRLSRPALTTVLGRRAAPGRGHVIVVGFGQVGFRLAQALIERRIPVVAVERNYTASCVRLARRGRVPVVIADGEDRATLELVGLRRATAVAAVTSDDLVNVSVALAAGDLAPEIPAVLRLGDGQVAAETESLLHLGEICDLHDVAAREITSEILGSAACSPQHPASRPA